MSGSYYVVAAIAASALAGCATQGEFRDVSEFPRTKTIRIKPTTGGHRIFFSPTQLESQLELAAVLANGPSRDDGNGKPVPPAAPGELYAKGRVQSAAAAKAIALDAASRFAEAYALLKSDASPICRALLANYERYSRPGLWRKTSPAKAEALCREVIARTEGSEAPDDRIARAEAFRLLPYADYGQLAENCARASAAVSGARDIFYDGGLFGRAFPFPAVDGGGNPLSPVLAEKCVRDSAMRGNERARRMFADNGSLDKSLLEYRNARTHLPRRGRSVPYLPLEGAPGFGRPGAVCDYEADDALKAEMSRYGFEAHWFVQGHPLDGDPEKPIYERALAHEQKTRSGGGLRECIGNTVDRIPFLLRRGNGESALPLVVYLPGNGEQGTDLKKQFRQRAVMEKVSSQEFQRRHPCHLLVPMPPDFADVNGSIGYPNYPDGYLQILYCDLISQLIRDGLAVDRSRIYLVGLGSGGTAATAMALDHPGRFAAVDVMLSVPYVSTSHPLCPMFLRAGLLVKYKDQDVARNDGFATAVERTGGEYIVEFHPATPKGKGCWWDAPWLDDGHWKWIFSKKTKGEVCR